MASPGTENCIAVRAVREALLEKMGRIESREDYGLLDLTYGRFSNMCSYTAHPMGQSELPPSGETRSLGRREFLRNILVRQPKPPRVYGYSYEIELARTNQTIGALAGAVGHHDDPLAEYCLVQLANGTTFEFEKLKEPGFSYGQFLTGNRPGRTTIRHNGSAIGECISSRLKDPGLSCESEWDLILDGEPFGKIMAPPGVGWNDLQITRPDGSRLPLILAFHVGFVDAMKAMWHILTFRAFRGKPWPNPDWIVPVSVRSRLTPKEIAFYFAISLWARVYYGLDDHSGFCNG